jgi:hypothetical protein
VAIIGGGPCGLATALALQRASPTAGVRRPHPLPDPYNPNPNPNPNSDPDPDPNPITLTLTATQSSLSSSATKHSRRKDLRWLSRRKAGPHSAASIPL